MIDDVKTFREVTAHLWGINEQKKLMNMVFVGSVGIGAACVAYLLHATATSVTAVARIEGTLVGDDKRFEQVDKRFDEMDRRFSDVDLQFEEIKVLLRSLQPRQQGSVELAPPGSPAQN